MSKLQVTMRESVFAAGGVAMLAGTVQTLQADEAAGLVQQNKATRYGTGWAEDPDSLTPAQIAAVGALVSRDGDAVQDILLAGDSMGGANNSGVTITSAIRTGGVITIVTASDLGVDTGQYLRTVNMVPEDFTTMSARVTRINATTYSYESAGPDGSAANLATPLKAMFALNPHAQGDSGIIFWLKSKLGAAFRLKHLLGRNGTTLANLVNSLSIGTFKFSDYSLAIIHFGYNDFAGEGRTAEAVLDDIRTLYAASSAASCRLLVVDALPWRVPSGPAGRAAAARYNVLLADFCKGKPLIRSASAASLVADGTNATPHWSKANYLLADGIHPTPRCAEQLAVAAISGAGDWLQKSNALVTSSADNVVYDPLSTNIWEFGPWINTGGVVTAPATGTAGAGFTVAGSANVAVAASVVARADGLGYDQVLTCTPSGTGIASVTFDSIPLARYAPGTRLVVAFEVDLAGVVGSTFRGANVFTSIGASAQRPWLSKATAANEWPQFDDTLTVISEEIVVGAVAPSSIPMVMQLIFSAAGSALAVKLGRVSVRKVTASA